MGEHITLYIMNDMYVCALLRDGRALRDGAPVPHGNSGTARDGLGWSGMVRDGPGWSRQSHTYGFMLSYYLVTSGFC